MNEDPIVVLISTYQEGKLVQGAILSALTCNPTRIWICEGSTGNHNITGDETDIFYEGFTRDSPTIIRFYSHEFHSETDKRNHMLKQAKRDMHPENHFWILTLDADEILVWGEYLRDYIRPLNPGLGSKENVAAIVRTEPYYVKSNEEHRPRPIGWWTDRCPSRLFHSSLIKEYTVGTWQILTRDNKNARLDNRPWIPPMDGQPHIQHRHFLRTGDRKTLREGDREELDWLTDRGLTRGENVI